MNFKNLTSLNPADYFIVCRPPLSLSLSSRASPSLLLTFYSYLNTIQSKSHKLQIKKLLINLESAVYRLKCKKKEKVK